DLNAKVDPRRHSVGNPLSAPVGERDPPALHGDEHQENGQQAQQHPPSDAAIPQDRTGTGEERLRTPHRRSACGAVWLLTQKSHGFQSSGTGGPAVGKGTVPVSSRPDVSVSLGELEKDAVAVSAGTLGAAI